MLKDQRDVFIKFALPTIFILLVLTVFPLVYSIIISFTNYNASSSTGSKFVGITNYRQLFHNRLFFDSVRNTSIIIFFSVVIELTLGSVLAIVFWQSSFYFKRILQTILILPLCLTPVAVSLMWKYMLNPAYGIVDYCLMSLGFRNIDWFGAKETSLISIILVDIWQWVPFVFIIILAGLEAIPKTLIDAIKIDGANTLQIFRYLLFPLLVPFFSISILLRVIDSFKIFDTVYVLTEGGPGSSTETLSLLGYKEGFVYFNTGIAAAESLILLVIVTLIAILLIKTIKRISPVEGT